VSRVFAIALNTFREAMRDKLLYTIVFFACALIAAALAIGQFSMHEEVRVTRDLGLGGISIFGKALAVFAGVTMVYKEIERKTVYALIPKPIDRWQFVVGKYAGMVLTLAVQVAMMALVLCGALLVQGASPDGPLARAILLLFEQAAIVAAVAVFFSAFSTPFLSGFFTVGVFLIGRSTPELRALIEARFKESPGVAAVLRASVNVVPDLHLFFVSGQAVDGRVVTVHAGDYVSWGYVAAATGYGALYTAVVLALAVLIFSRRDFI
jgi:ABC-2 family transporter protein